ncbi:cupin domain-containing protein [Jannaschia sp. M317]|uniref:cupin domain-containing protein n=1 Tax=Jannaschia sp. M317 TaxID=2867011 RepID=UPI0021A3BDA7|nr:cupin domain-containing protein [Jannaschia sp. M317]UWQ19900.1 cupin domain-containing protein [Jannaschia sp. M317]
MSRIVTIAHDNDRLSATEGPAPDLTPLEGLAVDYANLAEVRGVIVARGRVAPGAEVPAHAGPSDYLLYVLSGQGVLTLCDADGVETSRLTYAPGRLIVFPPDAQHGWINGDGDPLEWLGIDLSGL